MDHYDKRAEIGPPRIPDALFGAPYAKRGPQFTLFRGERGAKFATHDTCNSASSSVEQTYRRTFQPGGQTPRGNRGPANVYMRTNVHTCERTRAHAIPRPRIFRVILYVACDAFRKRYMLVCTRSRRPLCKTSRASISSTSTSVCF